MLPLFSFFPVSCFSFCLPPYLLSFQVSIILRPLVTFYQILFSLYFFLYALLLYHQFLWCTGSIFKSCCNIYHNFMVIIFSILQWIEIRLWKILMYSNVSPHHCVGVLWFVGAPEAPDSGSPSWAEGENHHGPDPSGPASCSHRRGQRQQHQRGHPHPGG